MSVKRELTLGYCPVGNGDSIEPFDSVFAKKKDISGGLDGVDAVIFWGGADIHPSLYKQGRSYMSQAGVLPTRRDEFEWNVMKYCKINRIPMIGICRGAQLMCAFAGGTLIQHTTGHNSGPHAMTTKEGEVMTTSSCHHQMLYPWDIEHEMLAWSGLSLSKTYLDGKDNEINMTGKEEPEVVYFPQLNGLAIQGHPEWVAPASDFALYCNRLVREYLFETVEV